MCRNFVVLYLDIFKCVSVCVCAGDIKVHRILYGLRTSRGCWRLIISFFIVEKAWIYNLYKYKSMYVFSILNNIILIFILFISYFVSIFLFSFYSLIEKKSYGRKYKKLLYFRCIFGKEYTFKYDIKENNNLLLSSFSYN